MDLSNQEKTKLIEQFIVRILKEHGVHVLFNHSITTNSVYLKFDYGVAHSMRISDHKGKKKYAYRYHVRLDLDQSSIFMRNGNPCYNACVSDTKKLLAYIIKQRDERIKNMGTFKYNKLMERRIAENHGKSGFWSIAKAI